MFSLNPTKGKIQLSPQFDTTLKCHSSLWSAPLPQVVKFIWLKKTCKYHKSQRLSVDSTGLHTYIIPAPLCSL